MTDVGVIKRCNNNCIMCTNIMPRPDDENEISKKEIKEIISNSPDDILITGGEPTLRNDLGEIIGFINKYFPEKRITLITNARRFCYKDYAKIFLNFKNLKIITELYASEEKLHDNITQTQNSFIQTYDGIKNILKLNINLELRAVVSGLNYADLPSLVNLYKEEFTGFKRLVIFPIDFVGNGMKNLSKVKYNFTEIMPFIEEASEIIPSKTILYHIPFCVASKKYWKMIQGVTVVENRVLFGDICSGCRFEKQCPKVWKSYAKKVGLEELKKIKWTHQEQI
ncbi:MAG: radical SAM protein [Nanobdellota archaeon]